MVLAHKRQLKLSSGTHRKRTLVVPFESVSTPTNDPARGLPPNPEAAPISSSVTNVEAPLLSSARSSDSILSSSSSRLSVRNSSDNRTSKRRRGEEERDSEGSTNIDFEFYGYPADSFIFANDEPEVQFDNRQESDPLPVVSNERSRRRRIKKRRKSDFVYY